MKKSGKLRAIMTRWNQLGLADKFLLIIMTILMIQTGYSLFFRETVAQNAASFDIVIRTTSAAIFGYFISSNFRTNRAITTSGINNSLQLDTDNSRTIGLPKATIGFGTNSSEGELQAGYAASVKVDVKDSGKETQVVIISTFGIICLIFLLITYNLGELATVSIAAVSQLRDFVSGSVGFLIGQSTQNKKQSPQTD